MGNLRACLAIATAALAGCHSSSSKGNQQIDAHIVVPDSPPDSPFIDDAPNNQFDFSCMGNSAPTTATATVTIAGTVEEVGLNGGMPTITPLVGAAITACTGNCNGPNKLDADPPTASMTTGVGGTYSTKAISTGSVPLDSYVKESKSGDRDTLVYPPAPLVASPPAIPMITFTNIAWVGVVLLLGGTQTPANGNLVLALTDCANAPLNDPTNVMISVKQNGQDVTGIKIVDGSQFGAIGGAAFVVFNVPPGATEVGASWKGMAMRAHTVNVLAATSTETVIRPGY